MIAEGKYSVWFKTPIGEGAGEVELKSDGTLSGGDTTFAYSGTWSQVGGRFKAMLKARRIGAGPPGVFGLDEVDIIVSGATGDEASISCAGFARQAPGLKLEATLIRADG